jgi:hypothetical protein
VHGGSPLPLSRARNEALSSQAQWLQALVPQGFAGQAGRSGVQDFWEVRRDSNAKSEPKGSYPQGPIISGSTLGRRPGPAKLLTTNGKRV